MTERLASDDPEGPIPSTVEDGSRRRRHGLAAAFAVLVAVVLIPPFININRFRHSIVRSVSAGLGRPVEASAVELQIFPLPGFVLHNLTVSEDPAYGAEPVLMAQTVTAVLRPSTLWHHRVEIARLSFDAPSVNLVRNAQGHWNFETLLRNSPALRPRSTPVPGASSASGSPMPFPYVEASDARINLKLGPEKLPFSLERATLEVWKEASNEWRVRIRARPVRTDLTVADAGELRGQGSLITEGALMNAAIRGNLEWRKVQLGEIGRLVNGEDDGWRGTADWTAQAGGTLADVAVTSDIVVEEFRRAEIIPESEMDLSAHCRARYAFADPHVDTLACDVPLGDGHLLFQRSASGHALDVPTRPPSRTDPNLKAAATVRIELKQVSTKFLLDVFRHVHPGVAGDANVSGEVNGRADCDWLTLDSAGRCTGSIRTTAIRITLPHMDRPLALSPLEFVSSARATVSQADPERAAWNLLPAHFSLGGAAPAAVTGTVGAAGFTIQIAGPAELKQLSRLAIEFRVPGISGEVESIRGDSNLNLAVTGNWLPRVRMASSAAGSEQMQSLQTGELLPSQEFVPSQWTGSLQMRNATLVLASMPLPIQLAAAHVEFNGTGIEWSGINGTFAHTAFDGGIGWKIPCPSVRSDCGRTFALHTRDLDVARFAAALHRADSSSSFLNLINPWAAGPPTMNAISGTLTADVLSLGEISVKNAALEVRMKGQTVDLTSISGRVFGGTLHGVPIESGEESAPGSMEWSTGTPVYKMRIALQNIRPDRVAVLWSTPRGRAVAHGQSSGLADVQLELETGGWSAADLSHNAHGKFDIAWRNGGLPVLGATPFAGQPQRFHEWDAKGAIRQQSLVLSSSRWIPQEARGGPRLDGAQSVTGTVTFLRMLHLTFHPSGNTVEGPLSAPIVVPPPQRQLSGAGADRN